MRRAAVIVLALLIACGPAGAQSADQPVMGSSAGTQDNAQPVEQTTRILVLGDAIGGGLGAGMLRLGEADGRYDVTIRFNEESGLARPEVYDWVETVPKILESSEYDVVVVLLGANDRQMIRSGNERFAFNTPGWTEAYKSQLRRLTAELARADARVFWVSLPPMADPEYDAAMRAITELQREQAEARGFTFIDIRPQFSTADGAYSDTGPDDTGEIRQLRGTDGISFFKQGNNRMAQLVLEAIGAGRARAVPPKPPEQEPVPPKGDAPAGLVKREVPIFGQDLLLGEVATLRPEDVTVNAVLLSERALPPLEALQAIRAIAPPGSAAERLLKAGEPSPAPKGRADDFSLPPAD